MKAAEQVDFCDRRHNGGKVDHSEEVGQQGATRGEHRVLLDQDAKSPDYDNSFVSVFTGGGVSKSRFLIVGRQGVTNEKAMTGYSCGLPPWQPWWKQQGVTQSSCFGDADSYSLNSNWTCRPYSSNHPIVPPSFARAQFRLGTRVQDGTWWSNTRRMTKRLDATEPKLQ